MTLPDAGARQQALDPLLSFCISAPAGSGKTGLLVQRFLCLLSRVAEPERVVAITFTRKAAAEMRARVLAALRLEAEDIAPQSDHEQRSRELARAVLEVDRRASWDLLANPSRLRIQTIDSFCGELARQMPVLSGFGGPLAASDNATALYREAIERFLQRELGASAGATKGAGTDSDLSNLLLHLDNQWEVAVDLLTRLLQRREQWQPVLGSSGLDDGERSGLQAVTASLVAFRIEQLGNLLAPEMLELGELMDFSRENHPSGSVGTAPNDALEDWRGVAGLLLTSTGVWRKSVNKRDGFPAGSGRAAQMKNAAKSLLSRLTERNDPALLQALRQLLTLPDPAGEPEHWNVLASLTRLLPRLGAELLLVFQQAGEVDHAQVAMAANAALGSDEAPTDIALRLDHNVEHLLVDEFQDTSSGQFELIRRLTRGWAEQNAENPEAPRTLLLVGDPMQSIYGFRDANVGLFIKARDEGLGELPLEALDLSVNFRSQSSLVDWVNAHFQGAFPPLDDAQLAAVAYRASSWAREGPVAPELRLFSGDGAEQAEADALCDSLEEGLSDDKVTSIAVLGRSRSQLRPVLEVMRERGIPYAARDLETLQHRPLIRDLVSLCAVLSDHFDRFAWLSLLRSPGIALDNEDLLHMALQAPLAIDVLAEERVLPILEGLSPAGRERVAHLLSLLRWAEHYRDRLAVRVWVEECWLRLGGAAPLADIGDRDDAEQFFQCLEQLAAGQHRLTARRLQEAVAALFAAPGDELAKVQVMTLHKAKGLEFDWVFIPALGKTTVHRDSELLLWDEFALPGQAPSFLLDIRGSASARAAPRLYDYLKEQARQKGKMEATRLFYVGCTRAAERLWLGASLPWDEQKEQAKGPRAGSLLATIWTDVEGRVPVERTPDAAVTATSSSSIGGYLRLQQLPEIEHVPAPSAAQGTADPDNHLARALGTAIHRGLESLVYRAELPQQCDQPLRLLLSVALTDAGCDSAALDNYASQAAEAVDRVLQDDWARWMLSPSRQSRTAEYPLTLAGSDEIRELVLDYVFLDEARGERWLIDYKTAAPRRDESPDAFMAAQLTLYQPQLQRYRQALQARFAEPVRCALYFTALGRHCEWQAESP